MLKLFTYLISQGVATVKNICPDLADGVRGLPQFTDAPCQSGCTACLEVCPTDAISILKIDDKGNVRLDLGNCIGCGMCVDVCPTGALKNNPTTKVAVKTRAELVHLHPCEGSQFQEAAGTTLAQALQNYKTEPHVVANPDSLEYAGWFQRSVAARVVSTGCSACDMELGASGNPIFDMERFGVQVVASPRFADILMVTGPVSKGMQAAMMSCYEAMSSPRVVIALGTCAISGGVHRGGYAEANGVDALLPVNVYIPGCPPHPWSIIHGVLLAMGKEKLAAK